MVIRYLAACGLATAVIAPAVAAPAAKPVIRNVESYLEGICAPVEVLKAGKPVTGCYFFDRDPKTVPGPRQEKSGGLVHEAKTIKFLRLSIDYQEQRASFLYKLTDEHELEQRAEGRIEADPAGGLIVKIDNSRGKTGIVHLSFDGQKAFIRGLAEIDYSVEAWAEPMDFVMSRDPRDFELDFSLKTRD
ncbi:hypothetical protein [Allosphingosinicella vermicomposti]|uniref:hypothetical protein n=1 Tax=Allosphingosinicella vermicomposti TaxID=614671 RepID=UPI000D0F2971|nr:hypothetical protein [Allosphingosinicella vermicomposti]